MPPPIPHRWGNVTKRKRAFFTSLRYSWRFALLNRPRLMAEPFVFGRRHFNDIILACIRNGRVTHSRVRGSGRPWPRAGEAKSNEMVRELWTGLDDGWRMISDDQNKNRQDGDFETRLSRLWNVGNWSGELNLVFLWIVWAIIQKLSPNLLTVAPRLWLTHTVTPCHPLYISFGQLLCSLP